MENYLKHSSRFPILTCVVDPFIKLALKRDRKFYLLEEREKERSEIAFGWDNLPLKFY